LNQIGDFRSAALRLGQSRQGVACGNSAPARRAVPVAAREELRDVKRSRGPKTTDSGVDAFPAGGVALASEKARSSALKVGYDTGRDQDESGQADNDIDDRGDNLVISNPFASTSITPTHDP